MNHYEKKRADRQARYLEKAQQLRKESDQRADQALKMLRTTQNCYLPT